MRGQGRVVYSRKFFGEENSWFEERGGVSRLFHPCLSPLRMCLSTRHAQNFRNYPRLYNLNPDGATNHDHGKLEPL